MIFDDSSKTSGFCCHISSLWHDMDGRDLGTFLAPLCAESNEVF
jgi:hypothetical protein